MKRVSALVFTSILLFACDGKGDEAGVDEAEGDGDGDTTGDDTTGDGDTTDASDDASDDADTTDATGDSTDTGEPACTGPAVTQPLPAQYEQPANPTVPGSTWAYFELTDFQPQSCNFGQTYSMESFKGRVTLLSLMRSTCGICQGSIAKLEEMQIQLELEGYEVWFVVINQPGYDDSQVEFINRASFPLLQDTFDTQAWELLNQLDPISGTDDIYIYTADGELSSYFSYEANNPTIMLETQAGWDNVYNAILAAM